jgi:thiamine biosynthesis lipoprotein
MGTLARITLYARDGEQARSGFETAFGRIRELDEQLSDYRPDSELMRLCARAGEGPVAVGSGLFRVIEAAQRLADQTNGEFDVTLGPVIRVWREARRGRRLPDPAVLEAAKRLAGFHKLLLDPDSRTIELSEPGMRLDLGGIAKGYAADEALISLGERGITRALVAIAGDLALGDPPPGRAGWRIGIDSPGPDQETLDRILELHNTAVSTSGDNEQHFEVDGVRYSHIVEPHEGQALRRSIGVTVVARRGIDADSLATAVSVMGAEKGLRFVEERTAAAALVAWRENGHFQERSTRNFPQRPGQR